MRSGKDILVVDDSPEDREIIREYLYSVTTSIYQIRIACDAEQANVALREQFPDCVLLDHHLPGQSGLSLLMRWNSSKEGLPCPVVLMTGSGDELTSKKVLDAGALDFLPKDGLSPAAIARAIEHARVRYAQNKERAAAIRRLEEREELFRRAQEAAGIGTFRWDLVTGRLRVEGAYMGLHGLPADHPPPTYLDYLELVHPDDREKLDRDTRQAIAQTETFSHQYRVIRPDGTHHWLLSRGTVKRDSSGRANCLIGAVAEITAIKSTEIALSEANSALHSFAATAGHDLQAPLRSISAFIELLSRTLGSSVDDQTRAALSFVGAGAARMRELVQDLLVFAQASVPLELAGRSMNLEECVQWAIENLGADIGDSGADIEWSGLPTVDRYFESTRRVFQNLISNSIKYGRPGVAPAIKIIATRRDEDWLISIADNGMGFSMESAAQIFEPFRRLHDQTISGSGLGLAICKRIIENFGGRIWAESSPGQGATFFFTLPDRQAHTAPTSKSIP